MIGSPKPLEKPGRLVIDGESVPSENKLSPINVDIAQAYQIPAAPKSPREFLKSRDLSSDSGIPLSSSKDHAVQSPNEQTRAKAPDPSLVLLSPLNRRIRSEISGRYNPQESKLSTNPLRLVLPRHDPLLPLHLVLNKGIRSEISGRYSPQESNRRTNPLKGALPMVCIRSRTLVAISRTTLPFRGWRLPRRRNLLPLLRAERARRQLSQARASVDLKISTTSCKEILSNTL